MEKIKLLSLVIPAYKQEKTIEKDIRTLSKVLSSLPFKYEIIVVNDGSSDKTLINVKRVRNKNVKIFTYDKNIGKGYAVKFGILKAKGDVVGFIDAGMDIEPISIKNLLDCMILKNADMVIGSKFHPESRVNYPLIRRMLSTGNRIIIYILFGLRIRDTQAGLKIFKKTVANKIFQKVKINSFAFDIEVLALARQMGFKRIYEAPIKVNYRKGTITGFNFYIVVLRMLIDTFTVFLRINTNRY